MSGTQSKKTTCLKCPPPPPPSNPTDGATTHMGSYPVGNYCLVTIPYGL